MNDELFMNIALGEARLALTEDEIPVGACLVREGAVIVQDHNRTRQLNSPLGHAEKLILDTAQSMGLKYLQDCALYVTLEPCLMCSGMIILSRVGRVIYGCSDPKAGASGSIYHTLLDKSFNHHPEVKRGVLSAQCALILTDFFRNKR
ncbi:MAG TPA: nucleoside deaminase [Candidatus Cloacimonadota bacterium]|nr:nucleoside deaminase [Candidatus Cloacimonadota bacterium]